ncbi:MAG: hypothetical protein ACI30I_04200 [Parabacteroides sp.]
MKLIITAMIVFTGFMILLSGASLYEETGNGLPVMICGFLLAVYGFNMEGRKHE